MTETIDQARELLEARLTQLEGEAKQLRQAIAQLGRDGRAARGRASSPSPASARARRASRSQAAGRPRAGSTGGRKARRAGRGKARARPGERDAQLLASIKQTPERRVSEHARELGVRPQQLYPVLRRLEKSKQVTKTPEGYRAT